MERTSALGWQVAAPAREEPRRHRAVANAARTRADDQGRCGDRNRRESSEGVVALDCAHGIELYDRTVDHLGAGAHGWTHSDLVGAAAAQEHGLRASRRPRDGIVRAAVLFSGD